MSFIGPHIDGKISDLLGGVGYDETRQFLFDNAMRFSKMLKSDIDFNSDINLDDIKIHRDKRVIEYVIHARKRVYDLYRIEREFSRFGFDPKKTFKLLLLIDKIKGVGSK